MEKKKKKRLTQEGTAGDRERGFSYRHLDGWHLRKRGEELAICGRVGRVWLLIFPRASSPLQGPLRSEAERGKARGVLEVAVIRQVAWAGVYVQLLVDLLVLVSCLTLYNTQ